MLLIQMPDKSGTVLLWDQEGVQAQPPKVTTKPSSWD